MEGPTAIAAEGTLEVRVVPQNEHAGRVCDKDGQGGDLFCLSCFTPVYPAVDRKFSKAFE